MKSFCIIALVVSAVFIDAAGANQEPAPTASDPPAATPGDTDKEAKRLLASMAEAKGGADRLAAAQKLIALNPQPVETLEAFLKRKRTTSDDVRRPLLQAVEAEVPNEKGRFQTPQRATKKSEKAKDEFDWLAELAKSKDAQGMGELFQDIAIIRALAASRNPMGGTAILAFGFSEEGMLYRDECGRYLRRMSPYSIPALIHGSQMRKNRDIRRYANYQLERLDRQNPYKAFAAAPTEELQIDIMNAFAQAQYREAVFVVLDNLDHVAPRVRAATLAAWTEYTTGRKPPKPPERKLELPNGALTEEEEPLWLDHRQLAEVAIRKRLEEETGEKPAKTASLKDMSETLISFYNQRRTKVLYTDLAAGLELSKAKKFQEASEIFDRILVQSPTFDRRNEMVETYIGLAKEFEDNKDWRAAAVAFGKANAVDPEGPKAKEALSKHHLARGKAAENEGEDATTEFALAKEIDASSGNQNEQRWMLFVGLAIIGAAAALLFLALMRRRGVIA